MSLSVIVWSLWLAPTSIIVESIDAIRVTWRWSSFWIIVLLCSTPDLHGPSDTIIGFTHVLVPNRHKRINTLQRHHNERDGVSNHLLLECLPNLLFRRRSIEASKFHVTGGFLSQRASNVEMLPFDDVIRKHHTDSTVTRFLHESCDALPYGSKEWSRKVDNLAVCMLLTGSSSHGDVFYGQWPCKHVCRFFIDFYDEYCWSSKPLSSFFIHEY